MSDESVSIIIPVFGNRAEWLPLVERAKKSAHAQTVTPADITVCWAESLRDARNGPAEKATGEFLVFLDADDELDTRYVAGTRKGWGDVRQPATLGIANGVEDDRPVMIPKCNLINRNYLVVGSPIRRSLFLEAGGFGDYPVLEDWELFLRLQKAGAEFGECPEAIYKVHVRDGSRNTGNKQSAAIYREIRAKHVKGQ